MALSLTFKMTSSTGAFERETPTISLKYSLKSIPSGCIMYGLDVSFTPSILSIAKLIKVFATDYYSIFCK